MEVDVMCNTNSGWKPHGTSHSGRWYIVSCECVNKSTIIAFPHHLLQISSADPQFWTQRKNDSLELHFVTHKVNYLKTDILPMVIDDYDDKPPNGTKKNPH